MQQEIKLTNGSSNTVFVDDVDVSKGIYNKYLPTGVIRFVFLRPDGYIQGVKVLGGEQSYMYETLKHYIDSNIGLEFYTIPDNKRIVTEREVTIDDLKSTDHIGILFNEDEKAFSTQIDSFSRVVFIQHKNGVQLGNRNTDNMKAAILKNGGSIDIKKVIRFDERSELNEWLNKK